MIKDALHFLCKLSLRKVVNIFLSITSYYLARFTGWTVLWGHPYAYSIEPTSLCNLRCPECPTGRGEILRDNNYFDMGLYSSILDQIAGETCYLMLFLQGEPFMSPHIFDMILSANQKGIYTCISTNGHFMDEQQAKRTVLAGLDRLIVSLDGTTADVYRKYRVNGNFQEVIAAIKHLKDAKNLYHSSRPYIILQFIVFKHNQHQIEDVYRLGKELGVNEVSVKKAQLYNYTDGHPMLTDLKKLARYENKNGLLKIKGKLNHSCKRIWTTGVITTDGHMTSCCYDKHSEFKMGNLHETNLRSTWRSEDFMKFRKRILSDRGSIDICQNCGEK